MIRIVLLLLLPLLVSSCQSMETSNGETKDNGTVELVQRHLDLAIGYLRNRDYQRSKEKLAKALDIEPKNADVHATYGLVFQLEGETDLAEEYFKRAVKYNPRSAQIRNSYGAFLFSEKRFHEAVDQLSKASEDRFYPNRPMVFENLGVAYNRIGDPEEAESAFIRATQLNPQQRRALIELGEIRFDQRNYNVIPRWDLRRRSPCGFVSGSAESSRITTRKRAVVRPLKGYFRAVMSISNTKSQHRCRLMNPWSWNRLQQ